MTYHSLAIYYDNQLAENEQKRVPRDNRFANLHKLHRAKNGEQQWYYPCVILGGGLRAHLPISLCTEVALFMGIEMIVSISVQR